MSVSRHFGVLAALCLTAGLLAPALAQNSAQTLAQAPTATHFVSYIEVTLAGKAAALAQLRALRDASAKEAGNISFEILQRIDRPQHFAVLEAWKDAEAAPVHSAAAHVKLFRDKLKSLLVAPIDERTHTGLVIGERKAAGPGAVFVLTHIDLTNAKKEEGFAAIKQSSADSAKDNGALRYEALQQTNRPNHVTLVEAWDGIAALDAHEAAEHTRKFRDRLGPISGSLYDQRLYRLVK